MRTAHHHVLSVVVAMLPLCSAATAGELADLFAKTHPKIQPDFGAPPAPGARIPPPPMANQKDGVSEISMERAGCVWKCPEYFVSIMADGTVRYIGGRYSPHPGIRVGKLRTNPFSNLARFIRDTGFMQMKDSYSAAVSDQETVYTSIVINGTRKIVSNYGNAGPPALWAIQELIDKIVAQTDWR
jgi:hypothetical protein